MASAVIITSSQDCFLFFSLDSSEGHKLGVPYLRGKVPGQTCTHLTHAPYTY